MLAIDDYIELIWDKPRENGAPITEYQVYIESHDLQDFLYYFNCSNKADTTEEDKKNAQRISSATCSSDLVETDATQISKVSTMCKIEQLHLAGPPYNLQNSENGRVCVKVRAINIAGFSDSLAYPFCKDDVFRGVPSQPREPVVTLDSEKSLLKISWFEPVNSQSIDYDVFWSNNTGSLMICENAKST